MHCKKNSFFNRISRLTTFTAVNSITFVERCLAEKAGEERRREKERNEITSNGNLIPEDIRVMFWKKGGIKSKQERGENLPS